MVLAGSSSLTSLLLQQGLADEIVLIVCPAAARNRQALLRRGHAGLRWPWPVRRPCRPACCSAPTGALRPDRAVPTGAWLARAARGCRRGLCRSMRRRHSGASPAWRASREQKFPTDFPCRTRHRLRATRPLPPQGPPWRWITCQVPCEVRRQVPEDQLTTWLLHEPRRIRAVAQLARGIRTSPWNRSSATIRYRCSRRARRHGDAGADDDRPARGAGQDSGTIARTAPSAAPTSPTAPSAASPRSTIRSAARPRSGC